MAARTTAPLHGAAAAQNLPLNREATYNATPTSGNAESVYVDPASGQTEGRIELKLDRQVTPG
jgi:hypothetical protein